MEKILPKIVSVSIYLQDITAGLYPGMHRRQSVIAQKFTQIMISLNIVLFAGHRRRFTLHPGHDARVLLVCDGHDRQPSSERVQPHSTVSYTGRATTLVSHVSQARLLEYSQGRYYTGTR